MKKQPTLFWGKRVISFERLVLFTAINFFLFLTIVFFDIGSTVAGYTFSNNIGYIIPSITGSARLTANFNSSFFIIALAWFFSVLFSIYITIDVIKNKVFVELKRIRYKILTLPGLFLFLIVCIWSLAYEVPYDAGSRSGTTLLYTFLKDAKYSAIFYAEFIFFSIALINMWSVMLIGGIISGLLKFETK